MQKSFTVTLPGTRHTLTATARLDGYFSLTAEEKEGKITACGCMHEDIARHFPELAPFIQWHLTAEDGTPMYYTENALYWAGFKGWRKGGPNDPPNVEHLKTTVVFGRLPRDTEEALKDALQSSESLTAFLISRLPDLRTAFHTDMKKLFGDEYTA